MTTPLTSRCMQVGEYSINMRGTFDPRKQPIVFVHGIGVSGRYFIPLAEALSTVFDVYVVDLPGYGNSSKPTQPLMIPELAKFLNETVQLLMLQNPIIVGQSMGCQIAAEAVIRAPITYSKLILIGPTSNSQERSLAWQAWRLLQDTPKESLRMNTIILADYLRMGMMRYLKTAKSMTEYRTESRIAMCRLPTLLLRGDKDKIAPHEWVESLRSRCAHAILVEVPGGPHNVHYEKPQQVAEACIDFIQS